MRSGCPLLEKVQRTIEEYRMFSSNKRVVVGVSGGPDSTTLLHLLFRFKNRYNLYLWAVHLNHQLRGKEAEGEAEWVRQFVSQLGIPVIVDSFDVSLLAKREGLSLEEAGRRARYDFFERTAKRVGAGGIALAHTASDQVETVLMRLIRGSGLDGLSGIPPVRGKIVRPLIRAFRGEIEEYCRENNLHPCIDSSNEDVSFLRNKIRLELIPYLCKNYNPRIQKTLFQTCEILKEENDFLQRESRRVFSSLHKRKEDNAIVLNLKRFDSLHLSLRRRVIREAIKEIRGNTRGIEFDHISSVLELDGKNGKRLNLPGGITAEVQSGTLLIKKEKGKKIPLFICPLNIPGRTKITEVGLIFEAEIISRRPSFFPGGGYEVYFDLDKTEAPLFFRKRKEGDKFQPLGMRGRKKIKDFFIDLKVPREERDRVPLLISRNRIAWVVGYRIDENFKMDKNTKKILRVKVLKHYE